MHDIRRKTWKEKLQRSSYFLGALLLHLIIFVMVATIVIWKAPPPPPTDEFLAVATKPPPPPPPQPPSSGGAANNPQFEPAPIVVPVVTPPSIISTANTSSFSLDASKVLNQALNHLSDQMARGTGLTTGEGGLSGSGSGNAFGSDSANRVSLTGTFYDLKQSRDHQLTKMNVAKEQEVLRDFFTHHWDEETFKRDYLSSSKPIYANEIIIPFQPSTGGPTAFKLQDECKPGYWAIVYHITFKPTRSGDFCLAGYGDDFLVVRVNGENVLDSGYYPPVTDLARTKTYRHGPWVNDKDNKDSPTYGNAVVGKQFRIEAATDMTIDVLISDAFPAGGGGRCGYFLMLLEAGKEYTQKDAQGNLILPLLQINADPNVKRSGEFPPFTCNAEDALISQ